MLEYIKTTRLNLNAEEGPECITSGLQRAKSDIQCKRSLFEYDADITALDLTPTQYCTSKFPRTCETDIDEATLPLPSDTSGDFIMKSFS